MNKWMLMMCVLCWGAGAGAQQKKKPASKPPRQAQTSKPLPTAAYPTAEGSLFNHRSYPAKAAPGQENLYIADPIIRALNNRGKGQNIRISGSGVVGSPRGTYGFANGQISLRTTDATSIGGITGGGRWVPAVHPEVWVLQDQCQG